jgi:hypothetical protein
MNTIDAGHPPREFKCSRTGFAFPIRFPMRAIDISAEGAGAILTRSTN